MCPDAAGARFILCQHAQHVPHRHQHLPLQASGPEEKAGRAGGANGRHHEKEPPPRSEEGGG
jgi:hypothetical protein